MKTSLAFRLGYTVALLFAASGVEAKFEVGTSAGETITGTADDDALYGDPIASAGGPLTLEKVTTTVDGSGSGVSFNYHAGLSSGARVISPLGDRLLVVTAATNVVPGVTGNGAFQIYYKDILTGAYVLVSSLPDGTPSSNDPAEQLYPSFSPDGEKVVFQTVSTNLLGAATNTYQIAVKNLTDGGLTVLSKNKSFGALGDGHSTAPRFSPDGTRIVFMSAAKNLVNGDTNNNTDIFLLNYTGAASDYQSIALASAAANGTQGNSFSVDPVFAPDGASIAFSSTANNLTTDTNNTQDIFVKTIDPTALDINSSGMMMGAVALVSADANGMQGAGCFSDRPTFSPLGNAIAFISDCAFVMGDQNNGGEDIFIKTQAGSDWQNGAIDLVSVDSVGTQPTGGFFNNKPVFSPDGTMLAFISNALGFDPAVTPQNQNNHLYVKDLLGAGTALISRASGGTPANNFTLDFAFMPDGGALLFDTTADNLTLGESGNAFRDIFRASLPGAPIGGNDQISGGAGNDLLSGGTGNDTLLGEEGRDALYGGGGDDILDGGDGDDILDGGFANDTLEGENGDDSLLGGIGEDSLEGGAGNDTLDGGAGINTALYPLPTHRFKAILNADQSYTLSDLAENAPLGSDTLKNIASLAFYDEADPGVIVTTLPLSPTALPGNEAPAAAGVQSFTLKAGETTGALMIANDPEDDPLIYTLINDATAGTVTIDAMAGTFTYTADADTLAASDAFTIRVSDPYGGETDIAYAVTLALTLTGTESDDILTGGAGNDTLEGLAGNDLLDGGSGADILNGGAGNDVFIVDHPNDQVSEGAGQGTDEVKAAISYTLPSFVENLTLTGSDLLSGTGNDLDNILIGNDAANQLSGLGGDDLLKGGGGADTMIGGTGNDIFVVDHAGDSAVELAGGGIDGVEASLSYTLPAHVENLALAGSANLRGVGNDLANMIVGNAGANMLSGGKGNDKLLGGAGKDVLQGGMGKDTLTGGAGADRFSFLSIKDSPPAASKRDWITDFNPSEKDVIDLSKIDADKRRRRNQGFSFIGARPFSGKAGELRFARGIVSGDVNGDRRADFAIKVTVKKGKISARNFKL